VLVLSPPAAFMVSTSRKAREVLLVPTGVKSLSSRGSWTPTPAHSTRRNGAPSVLLVLTRLKASHPAPGRGGRAPVSPPHPCERLTHWTLVARPPASNMNSPNSIPQRKIFRRLSIPAGNTVQIAGLAAACAVLILERFTHSTTAAIVAMIAGWVLLYFFCHGIAHWAAGRLLGIRFAFYTVGGTGNPQGYPVGPRWLFEHLPFFGVQTEKATMQKASPTAKAIMWSAGVVSSAVVPMLSAFCAWAAHLPGSRVFLLFAIFWAIGTLSSNWRSTTGDFSKARRALRSS
jgi:hypothetical protein